MLPSVMSKKHMVMSLPRWFPVGQKDDLLVSQQLINEPGFLFCVAQDTKHLKALTPSYPSGGMSGILCRCGINKVHGIRFEIFLKSGTVRLGPLELIIYLNFCDSEFEVLSIYFGQFYTYFILDKNENLCNFKSRFKNIGSSDSISSNNF